MNGATATLSSRAHERLDDRSRKEKSRQQLRVEGLRDGARIGFVDEIICHLQVNDSAALASADNLTASSGS